jgi:hypothetical protein
MGYKTLKFLSQVYIIIHDLKERMIASCLIAHMLKFLFHCFSNDLEIAILAKNSPTKH